MTPKCNDCLGYHGQSRPCPAFGCSSNDRAVYPPSVLKTIAADLTACPYCESGNHDGCVNALCNCPCRQVCGKSLREWQEVCSRHNLLRVELNTSIAIISRLKMALYRIDRGRDGSLSAVNMATEAYRAIMETSLSGGGDLLSRKDIALRAVIAWGKTVERLEHAEGLNEVIKLCELAAGSDHGS